MTETFLEKSEDDFLFVSNFELSTKQLGSELVERLTIKDLC
jgi:hypothetical protein